MRKTMALIALAMMTRTASAQEADDRWVYVVSGPDRARVTVDTRTLRRSGQSVDAWYRISYPTEQRNNGKTFRMMLEHERFDCSARTTTLLYFAWYSATGNTVASYTTSSYEMRAEGVPPDTMLEGVLDYVCANG